MATFVEPVGKPADPPEEVPPPACERVVLYCRVSTVEQDLAGQERELREEAARRGWQVADCYSEKVSATGKVERTQYDLLRRAARDPKRRWNHLLVWALDWFSREETFTKATQVVLELEQSGTRFHSLKEPMLDAPEDGKPNLGRDVLLALLPVIASFESAMYPPPAPGRRRAGCFRRGQRLTWS